MSDTEFQKQKNEAVKYMREMNSRADNLKNPTNFNATQNAPPKPNDKIPQQHNNEFTFSSLFKNSDTTIILGLLLLLLSENADKKLLFALVYILL